MTEGVIAIDGPAGAGKSTVAEGVAVQLGMPYVNTGALYRTVALGMHRAGVDPRDEGCCVELAQGFQIGINGTSSMLLGGEDVTGFLRAQFIEDIVSIVAQHPGVRACVRVIQHQVVADHDGSGVVEGRDIGTQVFPGAELKIFLTAPQDLRMQRVTDGHLQKGRTAEEAVQLARVVIERDTNDMTRTHSPLVCPDDAVTINTEGIGVKLVVNNIVGLWHFPRMQRPVRLDPANHGGLSWVYAPELDYAELQQLIA